MADPSGVGPLDDDAIWFDLEARGGHLRKRRFRALSDRWTARLQVHKAVIAEPHARRIGARDVRHAAPHVCRGSRAGDLHV